MIVPPAFSSQQRVYPPEPIPNTRLGNLPDPPPKYPIKTDNERAMAETMLYANLINGGDVMKAGAW